MATPAHVEGNVNVVVAAALVPDSSSPSFASLRDTLSLTVTHAFTGTGGAAGSAENAFRTTYTINAASNQDVDLASSVENAFGDALAFVAVKAVVIRNKSTTLPITVSSSGPGTPWTAMLNGTVTIRPGGVFVVACSEATGYAVSAGATDTFRIANAGGSSVDVDVVVIGNV